MRNWFEGLVLGVLLLSVVLRAEEKKTDTKIGADKKPPVPVEIVFDEELSPSWWLVVSCTAHDLDTWTQATIEVPNADLWMVRKSIRLEEVDACEVTYARQAVLKGNGSILITEAERAKGKEGVAKLEALAKGGKRYVKLNGKQAAYGRLEGPLAIVTADGKFINVGKWIKENGYERPTGK